MELAAYLVALPRDTLDALYESRWTCLAVLRSLPALGAQYLLRMLLVDAPVTQGAFHWWHTLVRIKNKRSQHPTALLRSTAWHADTSQTSS